ncbi:hypothetical protein GOP47_0013692 [Adiantum capillus-veneris]|uniref:HMA domain-containing protein n=1 Tax=Adiantum capillus-veneris TaxID=13818 RepID=A0A9D4ZG10_ADICA|nr:hypothetical protein GOP47_0013692 [Adiantum capillus-veneris]
MQCIVLKVDLGCCKGCRERICRNLMRVKGVKEVKVKEDDACIVVRGEGFNERDIIELVKKRKGRSRVEVIEQLPRNELPNVDNSAHQMSPADDLSKPKCRPPRTAADGGGVTGAGNGPSMDVAAAVPFDSSTSMKGETVVTERMHEEFEGTKIRTRVTTSWDVCTCILVEETRFIIDKQHFSKGSPCTEVAFDANLHVEAHVLSSRHH